MNWYKWYQEHGDDADHDDFISDLQSEPNDVDEEDIIYNEMVENDEIGPPELDNAI